MFLTVKEAIARGKRMVNYPVYAIMALSFCIFTYLIYLEILPLWFIPPTLLIGPLSGWLYWSFMITKWRLWAFENVRNVHELEKKAVLAKLIWPANSFFEKTEIRSAAEREKWKTLQEKFREKDVFLDDFDVPPETRIHNSKVMTVLNIVVGVGVTGYGLYGIIIKENYVMEGVITAAGLYMLYHGFNQAFTIEARIILNSKGIQGSSSDFAEWKDVFNEEIITERSGKHNNSYLVYHHRKGYEKIYIDELDTNTDTLMHLMSVYRGRSKT